MLKFRTMRTAKNFCVVSALLFLCGPILGAAEPVLSFHPGMWEIDSVTTTPAGRAVSSQTTLCAKEQIDFWKVAQAGLTCKTPKNHPESATRIRVRVHCEYKGDRLHSDILSDAVETISDHGNSFTLEGTTTTYTVYQGVQPKQTSIHLHATAHRTGECQ
jgi:hypothetical protein